MNQSEVESRIAALKGMKGKDYYQQQAEAAARVQRENAENGFSNITFAPERPTPPSAPRVIERAGMGRHDVIIPAGAPVLHPAVERKFRNAWRAAQNTAGTSNQPTLADLTTFLEQEKVEQKHYDYIRSEAIRLGILQGRGFIEATDETRSQMQARLFDENVHRPSQQTEQQSPSSSSSFSGIRRPGSSSND